MATNVLMPALSPTMEQGKLSKWVKKVGDQVKSGDILTRRPSISLRPCGSKSQNGPSVPVFRTGTKRIGRLGRDAPVPGAVGAS